MSERERLCSLQRLPSKMRRRKNVNEGSAGGGCVQEEKRDARARARKVKRFTQVLAGKVYYFTRI